MKSSTRNEPKRNLLFISLSNQKTLQNSIHTYILNFLKDKFENIFVFCLGKKSYHKEDNLHYLSGNFINWYSNLKQIKKIDYIYINDFFLGGFFGVFVKKTKKIPLLFRCGSPWRYELSSPSSIIKTLIIALTKPFVIKNCDKVVYNSRAIVQRQYQHNWAVVYNGVDTDLFKPMKAERIGPKLSLIFIGNLNKEKGLEYLFQAIKGLENQVHLTIVGDGPLLKKYQKKYPFVNFAGRLPRKKLPLMINQHDVFVFPSFVESFPNVLLEAMACGKPVITTNVYGIPEVVENGINGFLVLPKNPGAIKVAVNTFLEKPALVERIGKKARKTVEERFEKERQIQKLYKSLL